MMNLNTKANHVKAYNITLDFDQKIDFQQILTNPILDIAARFWEDDRYNAFKTCYRSMRLVDDIVDIRKSTARRITEAEILHISMIIDEWIDNLIRSIPNDTFQRQLIEIRKKFLIPLWPWKRFSKSMIYDIKHDGFKTFQDFIKYSEGAAVAPASIFVHLCGVVKKNGHYKPPKFDVKETARPLAIFSYLVHIFRDFQEDQKNNLNYLADDLTEESGLNKEILKEIAAGGEIKPGFRDLMQKYYAYAEDYRKKARKTLNKTSTYLEPRYQLSLEIIYSLYLQIFEKIDVSNGNFTTLELIPTPQEIKDRINQTVSSFEY